MTDKHIIVFHKGCLDGMCAAAVVSKFLGDDVEKQFIPAVYDDAFDPNQVDKNTIVWVVDFSFPINIMWDIDDRAKRLIWIDHHMSIMRYTSLDNFKNTINHFDVHKSGASLAWDALFSGRPMPPIVSFIEDRDLWKFRLPDTRAFTEALYTMVQSPEDPLFARFLDSYLPLDPTETITVGKGLLLAKSKRIERAMNRGYYGQIRGKKAFYVNSAEDVSEIGEAIYSAHAEEIVAVIYHYISRDEIKFSLRSNTVNVREIAEKFGGGGHDFAAGFTLMDKRQEFIRKLRDFPWLQ